MISQPHLAALDHLRACAARVERSEGDAREAMLALNAAVRHAEHAGVVESRIDAAIREGRAAVAPGEAA